MTAFRRTADGIVVAVRLTPKASRDSVDGIGVLSDGRQVVVARVRAVPDKGAANAALTVLLAKTFGVPKSAASLESGATMRLKQVRLAGEPDALIAKLESLPAA